MTEPNLRQLWERATPWERHLADEVRELRDLWLTLWQRARAPAWAVERAAALPGGPWQLLVISEDWCGDAVNTLPHLGRLAEAVPTLEMRVLRRDENPELMDRYLTAGSRSIPVVVVLDAAFAPAGRWGPRPAELQAWVLREKAEGRRPAEEIYREVRRWYARDGGASPLRELLQVLEAAAAPGG